MAERGAGAVIKLDLVLSEKGGYANVFRGAATHSVSSHPIWVERDHAKVRAETWGVWPEVQREEKPRAFVWGSKGC